MQRVMAIIQKLVSEILHNDKESIDGPQLVKMLISEGYDSDEIEQALSLVFSLPDIMQAGMKTLDTSLAELNAVFTPEERFKLDLEAQNYLLGLVAADLLDHAELEHVLGEAVALQVSQVGIPELQWIVGRVVEDDIRSFLLSTAPLSSADKKATSWWN